MTAAGGCHTNEFQAGYRAYLLRCWQEIGAGPDREPMWRFVLVRAGGSRTRRCFAALEDLVAFLREELTIAGQGHKRNSTIV